MKKRTLIATLCMACVLPMGAQNKKATLNLTATTRYQHIDGFGGTAMTPDWRDAYNQTKVDLLWGTGENQVGLNIMRLRINPNEGNWGEYGNAVRWARQVNPSLQVFATPWTPPKKFKTHNTTKYQNDFGTWVWPLVEHSWGGEGSNGGAIDPAHYDDFADFLERYRQTMEERGCPIDMISIQNESDYTPTATDNGVEHASYESCIYSPKEMAAMCKALRQKLDPKCKIMGPECFGWGQHDYNNRLVTIKDAVDNIDIWGNHLYGTNNWAFVQNVTNKTGKPMWETEFLIDYPSGYDGSFTAEYEMIESIEKAMLAGYSAYVYYSMYTHFFASNHGGSDSQLWKRAYVFSHYAKYATGKTRIRHGLTDSTGKLKGGSAYISEQGDTVTVFVLNTSPTNTYDLTIGLPFVPAQITQVATGQTVSARKSDVTASFANGTERPVVKLLPGLFYTFQFTKTAGEAPSHQMATSPKQPNYANPLSANRFMADPTAVEHNGRLYVYATDDQQEFDYTDGLATNSYGHISRVVCLSTDDMVNWTLHGTIDVKSITTWANNAWAPSVVCRDEADGKTHFYLYFTNGASSIGVLTATSPTGPWTDPLGRPLIDRQTPGLGKMGWVIDPGVCIKPDGSEAYLAFGGGDPQAGGSSLMPGNARIVKLGSDMTSLASDIVNIDAPCHFEANELNYIGNKWVFTYSTRWDIASNWSTYSATATPPTACSMAYMTASDPLANKWQYKGVMLPNPGNLGYPYGNNHSHLHKFNGGYYLLYHTQWLEQQLSLNGGYRNLMVNKVNVKENTAIVTSLTQSTATLVGVSQLSGTHVDPYQEHPATMTAIVTDDWWMVRGVDFNAQTVAPEYLLLRVKGSGTIDVRLQARTSQPVAEATFAGGDDEEQLLRVPLKEQPAGIVAYLYFMFAPSGSGQVLSWQFCSKEQAEAIGDITAEPKTGQSVFDLSGRRLSDVPKGKGIYVVDGRKTVVR